MKERPYCIDCQDVFCIKSQRAGRVRIEGESMSLEEETIENCPERDLSFNDELPDLFPNDDFEDLGKYLDPYQNDIHD
jgi:hypothetical protein